MTHSFDKDYWEQHWEQVDSSAVAGDIENTANPYLARELAGLTPGSALDAGCGTGVEALWLAAQGWSVTGADISAAALTRAAESAAAVSLANGVTWVEADLTAWEPDRVFDLVVTSYAHPAIPQLAFYDRIARWVAPGGTLLIVGHRHDAAGVTHGQGNEHGHDTGHDEPGNDDGPPVEATVTVSDITARLDPRMWRIDTAEEETRERPGGQGLPLHDVIVRASRVR